MVRLSSPLSSRVILAGAQAVIGGALLFFTVASFYGDYDEPSSSLVYGSDQSIGLLVLSITALGPLFGPIVCSIPFFPFTFIYASFICPSRITITDTEIQAKFFSKTKTWPMSALDSVSFSQAGENQFIVLKVAGKKLKAEIEHGRWGRIRDLIPPEVAARAK